MMPVVSVTRLRVRSWWRLPEFLWLTFAVQRQVKRSSGFLAGALGTAPKLTFWTTTVWNDEGSMKQFRDTGAHKPAMRRLLDLCEEASLTRWTQETAEVPTAAEMLDRLRTSGRISKVRHPTAEHDAGNTVPDGRPPRMSPLRK
jgi:hypothetical protein